MYAITFIRFMFLLQKTVLQTFCDNDDNVHRKNIIELIINYRYWHSYFILF